MAGIRMSGLASGLDTENIIKDLMKVQTAKKDKIYKDQKRVEWTKDVWKDMNTKLYSFYTSDVFKLKNASTFGLKTSTSSDPSAIGVSANADATTGVHKIQVNDLATGSTLTSSALGTSTNNSTTLGTLLSFTGNKTITLSADGGTTTKDIVLADTDKIEDVVTKLKASNANLNVSFDSTYKRFFMSTKTAGSGNDIQLSSLADGDLLDSLGFLAANRNGTLSQDASFTYNGTTFQSKTNEVTINNIKMTLKAETSSEVSITINKDVEGIYNNIKNFVTSYNDLLATIDTKLDATSAKGYEPLTDEEKSALDSDTVKLWEDKVKGSLLRRDQTLTTIRSSIRSIVTASNGVNTSKLSANIQYLSDIGIETGNYTEKGKLHIGGEDTDPTYSLKENKLKKMLDQDPEGVVNLLVGIGEKLSSELQEKMKASTISSALTFFNDKQMNNKISEYETRMIKLEAQMAQMEERYNAQFSSLEQIMSKTQSQSSWLAGQTGG